MVLLQLLSQTAPETVGGLPDWLKLGSGLAGSASMTVLAWALYNDRLVSGKRFAAVQAERDAARADVKTLTDGMMTEVIPLVTRQGDLLRAIEPRIQPTIKIDPAG